MSTQESVTAPSGPRVLFFAQHWLFYGFLGTLLYDTEHQYMRVRSFGRRKLKILTLPYLSSGAVRDLEELLHLSPGTTRVELYC